MQSAPLAPEGTSTPPVSAHTTMLLNTIGRQRDQLTEMTADRDALRAERDEAEAEASQQMEWKHKELERADKAEARADAAEKERDRLRHDVMTLENNYAAATEAESKSEARSEAAEKERDRAVAKVEVLEECDFAELKACHAETDVAVQRAEAAETAYRTLVPGAVKIQNERDALQAKLAAAQAEALRYRTAVDEAKDFLRDTDIPADDATHKAFMILVNVGNPSAALSPGNTPKEPT